MEIKYLNISNLLEVMNLQKIVFSYLDKKGQLETLSEKEFEVVLGNKYSIGVYESGELIAFRTLLVPDINDENHLADDIGVDRRKSIYSEISLVHPKYRGRKLQSKMGALLIEKVIEENSYNYVLATVAPDNIASLKDKFKLGFKIYRTKYKYNQKLRHVMMLDLSDQNQSTVHDEISVSFKDTEWMLTHGHEYIGNNIENGEIHYYKKS